MAAIINKNKCINCKRCYDRCPEDAFGLDEEGKVYVEHPYECWLCGVCEMDCPAGAIQVLYDVNNKPMFIEV